MRKKSLAKLLGTAALAGLLGASAQAATLVHDYQLNGSLLDALGGPALQSLGGTLDAVPGRYSFGPNQGVKLENGLNDTHVWSIEFKASFDSLVGTWKKMVDFQNLSIDDGIYLEYSQLQYYPQKSVASGIEVGRDFTVVLTRDALGTLRGYVDGKRLWSIKNDGGYTNNSVSADNVLHFFVDDRLRDQKEAQAGSLDYLRIYDGVLTDAEIAGVPTSPVPEPGTVALLSAGLLGLAFTRRHKKA